MATDISLSWEDGSTITRTEAIKQQYEIALFTSPGELSAEPDFGIGLKRYIGEVNNEKNAKALKQLIVSKTKELFPEISLTRIEISRTTVDTISITIEFAVIPFAQVTSITRTVGA